METCIYRDYSNCNKEVIDCYKYQRAYQSLSFVKYLNNKYCVFKNCSTFWDLFEKLKDFKDLSDPDINLTNHHHLFQTAEGIRKDGYPDWMQLVGLIHDLGKILFLKGNDFDGTSIQTQWSIVGDTFITGCRIPDEIIFKEFNSLNMDYIDKRYNSLYGIYKEKQGLNNVYCCFGHDEYLYQLLKYNKVNLPTEAYYMIRFHSLYLWHDKDQYSHLEDEQDKKMKPWVKKFNKYDLYTKENIETDEKTLLEYYDKIVKKYLPDKIYW